MANTIKVDIVSAEEELFSGEVQLLVARAELGEVGITPGHAQMITRLIPGEIRLVNADGSEDYFYVSGGMLEVQPDVITVLADTALRAKDIDEAEAIRAKERAEKALAEKRTDIDYARAQAEIAEAAAQLRTLQDLRKRVGKGRS